LVALPQKSAAFASLIASIKFATILFFNLENQDKLSGKDALSSKRWKGVWTFKAWDESGPLR